MIKNRLILILSLLLSVAFYYYVIQTPSIVNFIPFAIHEEFFKNVIKEQLFIQLFDFIISLIVFIILYAFLIKKFGSVGNVPN
jgi:hypothetical protein